MHFPQAPLSHEPLRYAFPPVERETLSNGTSVFLIPRSDEDLFTITVGLETGSVYDVVPGETSFAAEMLGRGTERLTAEQFADEVEGRGCTVRTSADRDAASIYGAGLAEYAEDIVELASEAFLSPRFDAREADRQCQRRLADILMNASDPEWLASRAGAAVSFGDHPYTHQREGTAVSLPLITRERMLAVHQRLLTAPRAIVVAGKFDSTSMMPILERTFGTLPKSVPQPAVPQAHVQERTALIARKDDAVQTAFRIVMPGVGFLHADYPAMQLISEVLGGFQLARLFTILREQKGYTYGANSFVDVRKHANTLMLATSVGTEFTTDTVATIAGELKRLRTELIDEEEMENARQSLLGQFVRSTETPQQTAGMLWQIILHGLPMDYFDRHVEHIQKLTPELLLPVQQRLFDERRWAIGASGVWDVVRDAVAGAVDSIEAFEVEK
ncbi:MAG: pitrilysin family protein [bacterium]|nr:pitrilysin family protein [bacterium]